MKKLIFCAALMAASTSTALAQSGTNSPYSQYGLGLFTDQGSGLNRGMNGLGLGFHEHNQLNYLNPASYSALDSLSFIFDAGLSGQVTNFQEGGVKKNANNANFEYVTAGFRAAKHVGVSFGVIPYTNIGYDYSTSGYLNKTDYTSTTYTNTYSGSGGIHEVYIGAAWEPFKGFSFGANVGYFWGTYTKSVVNSYSDSYVNTLSKYYTATVNSYKVDLGVQYTAKLSKKDELTLGATFTPGHKLAADPKLEVISTNSQTSIADTTSYSINNGLKIPTSYGLGFMYNHGNSLKVGFDYTLQKWGSVGYPQYTETDNVGSYTLLDNIYSDRKKYTLGASYCKNENGRRFIECVRYRIGASYATPYYRINGQDGPKEYSVSAGFGIPIVNGYNNRSILNISAQWVRQEAVGLIKENTFRINIGLTFNERWFAKWKVE